MSSDGGSVLEQSGGMDSASPFDYESCVSRGATEDQLAVGDPDQDSWIVIPDEDVEMADDQGFMGLSEGQSMVIIAKEPRATTDGREVRVDTAIEEDFRPVSAEASLTTTHEAVTEPPTEPLTNPIAEASLTTHEAITKLPTESVTNLIAEASLTTHEAVTEPPTEPLTNPIAEASLTTTHEAVTEPSTESVTDTPAETGINSPAEPVTMPPAEPVTSLSESTVFIEGQSMVFITKERILTTAVEGSTVNSAAEKVTTAKDSITKTPAESVTSPPAEPDTRSSAEPVTNPTTEPVTASALPPVSKLPAITVTNPFAALVTSPPAESVTSPPAESVTSPPAESITSPPAESITSPPAESITSPPAESITSPPESVTSPPAESVTSTPAEPVTSPPAESITSPPAESITSPPAESVTSPPAESVTSPPAESITSPPAESITSPPAESVTSPPAESVTSAPAESVTSAPAESVTSPPAESVTSPPAESVTSTPAEPVTSTPAESVTSPPAESVTSPPAESVTSPPAESVTTPAESVTTPVESVTSPAESVTENAAAPVMATPASDPTAQLLALASDGEDKDAEILVAALVEAGADLEATSTSTLPGENGMRPLHLACWGGNTGIATQLLLHGADPTSSVWGTQAVHWAAFGGHVPVLEVLAAAGVNLSQPAVRDYSTPLHLAAENGNEAAVKWLVERGVSVLAPRRDKTLAAKLARQAGHRRLHAYLNARAKAEQLLVMAADGDIKEVQQLMRNGADVNAASFSERTRGWRALHLAAKGRNKRMVKALLQAGANVDARTFDGLMAIHVAVQVGCLEIVQLLLPRCQDRQLDLQDEGLVHMAAKGGHLSVLQYLHTQQYDIHALTTPGAQTTLHLAARYGSPATVEWLLKEGVDMGLKDVVGLTALDYATMEGHTVVMTLLQPFQVDS